MNRRQPRRLHRALLASLLLHAVLLAWVVWKVPARGPIARPSKPIEIDLVVTAPPVAPVPAAPTLRQPAASPRAPTAKKSSRQSAPPAPSAPVADAPAVAGASALPGEQADSPRNGSTFLVPRVGTMLPGLAAGEESEAAGRTLRNGPGEQPDVVALREYTEERTRAKLDDQLGDLVARAQRENGLVDPYFTHLQEGLTEGFRGADVKLTRRGAGQLLKEEVVDSYTQPAERFAKTGSPLANDEQARQFTDSSFGRLVDRGGIQAGDVHDQRMLQAGLQSMAFSQVIKDSASRPRLKTVLMLRQDGDGALAETTVLERSGDSQFDEFVLHLTRKVVRDQGDTSDDGGAPSALGWSSVWQFTWEPPQVKVKLLRVLRGSKGSWLKGAQ